MPSGDFVADGTSRAISAMAAAHTLSAAAIQALPANTGDVDRAGPRIP